MIRRPMAAAVTIGLLIVFAHSLEADVKSDQKSLVKFEGMLGRVVNLFGGKAAREGVTTSVAVKGDRKASMSDSAGQIVDLKEEKIYDVDMRKKTYKVTTFAELQRRMEEARKKAEEDAKKAQAQEKTAKPAADGKDQKQMDVDFDLKETGQKKTINGFETREIVMTITMREKGKTVEQSGGMVLTSDIWMGSRIAAMQEIADFDIRYARQLAGPMIADFDIRYARQLAGPMIAGASPDEMAAAVAMYPMMKDAIARMRAENVKMDGTPIQTTTTIDAVKSEEQVASEQQQQQQDSRSASPSNPIGSVIGGLTRRAANRNNAPAGARATFMTMTNEVLKVATTVSDADVAIPAGFKESK
jgi:hypothetical protein